jgi:MFS family permease
MLGSNSAGGVVVGILAILVFAGQAQLWELYLLSFIFGVVDAVFYPAFDSMPPSLLPEARLGSGNALLQGSAQLATLLGPALAGLIIAAVGTATGNGSAFAFDAASFFLAAVALLLMRGGNRRQAPAGEDGEEQALEEAPGLLGSIKQGITYVWHDITLRAMVFVVLAANFAVSGPADVGLPALAHNRFGSAAAFGIMLSAFGLGALAGTVVAGSLGTLRRRGVVLIGVAAAFSIGLLLIGLAPNAIVASAVLAILGASNGFISVDILTWLQAGTAKSMMGRVMSLFTLANFGLTPLSLVASGAIAQVNLTGLFMLGAGLMGVVTLAVAASPTMRHFD